MGIFNLACQAKLSAHSITKAEILEEARYISKQCDVAIGGMGTGVREEETRSITDADGSHTSIINADA